MRTLSTPGKMEEMHMSSKSILEIEAYFPRVVITLVTLIPPSLSRLCPSPYQPDLGGLECLTVS